MNGLRSGLSRIQTIIGLPIKLDSIGRTLLENLINLLLNTHGLTTEYTDIGFPSKIITAMGIRWDFGPAPILKTFMWSIMHQF